MPYVLFGTYRRFGITCHRMQDKWHFIDCDETKYWYKAWACTRKHGAKSQTICTFPINLLCTILWLLPCYLLYELGGNSYCLRDRPKYDACAMHAGFLRRTHTHTHTLRLCTHCFSTATLINAIYVVNLNVSVICCYAVLKHVGKDSFDCVWKKPFQFHLSVIICCKPDHGHWYEFLSKLNFKSVFHGNLNGFFFVNIVWATDKSLR